MVFQLNMKISECRHDLKTAPTINCVSSYHLKIQVDNRYFVSAGNATKIMFLVEVAIEYLQYTGKDKGNNLQIA